MRLSRPRLVSVLVATTTMDEDIAQFINVTGASHEVAKYVRYTDTQGTCLGR